MLRCKITIRYGIICFRWLQNSGQYKTAMRVVLNPTRAPRNLLGMECPLRIYEDESYGPVLLSSIADGRFSHEGYRFHSQLHDNIVAILTSSRILVVKDNKLDWQCVIGDMVGIVVTMSNHWVVTIRSIPGGRYVYVGV